MSRWFGNCWFLHCQFSQKFNYKRLQVKEAGRKQDIEGGRKQYQFGVGNEMYGNDMTKTVSGNFYGGCAVYNILGNIFFDKTSKVPNDCSLCNKPQKACLFSFPLRYHTIQTEIMRMNVSVFQGRPIAPANDPSSQIDAINAMLLEYLAGCVTPGPTSTVHQIRVLLLELADPLLHIPQRNQHRVSDIPRLPLSLTPHIHHHKLGIALILVDHVLCLGCIHAHLYIIPSGKSNPKLNTQPQPFQSPQKHSQKQALSPKLHQIEQTRHGDAQSLEQILPNNEVDMRSPSDEAIEVISLDIEVDIESMDGGTIDVTTQDVGLHFLLYLCVGVFGFVAGDAGGVPGYVAVLETAEKDDLAEVAEMAGLAQLVQEGFTGVAALLHGKLLETVDLLPSSYRPKSHLYQAAHTVQVTQVRRAEAAEETELVLVLFEVRDSGTGNDAAHAMSDQVNDHILLLVLLHIVTDIVLYFLCHLFAHNSDVSLSTVFIALGDQVVSLRKLLHDPAFDQHHIVGGSLEAVTENHQHVLL